MAKYVYEKFKVGSKKVYIFSQHDGDNWTGPAIEHQCKENSTSIGFMADQRKFSFQIEFLGTEGKDYIIRENNKDGYPNGPVIVASNDALYFGPYYAKRGFDGIVYKVKKGEKIHIQEYKHGVLVDECLNDNIIYEDVARVLPFDAWYELESDELVERKINNRNLKGTEYIAGDPTSHLIMLAARATEEGNVTIGQFKNNMFNGLAMEHNADINYSTIQTYDSDNPTKEYRLLHLPQDNRFSLVLKDTQINDGKTEYVSIFFKRGEKGCEFGIQYLNKKEEAIGDPTILPNYIDPAAEKPYGPSLAKHLPKKGKDGLTARERLEAMIGLDNVKSELKKLTAIAKKNPDSPITLNMCFYGNPGTGKTEVAKILAEILYDEGILKENKLIDSKGVSGLIGEYVGQTQPKTHKLFASALNGVLFIDEAYLLSSGGFKGESGGDFGAEAIGALLEDMEKYRGEICVIFAGYRKQMEDMIASNPGFGSRINRKIDFPDYTEEELSKIASLIINGMKYSTDNEVISSIAKIVYGRKFLDDYANARDVRVLIEKLTEIQAERTIDEKSNRTITMDDVNKYNEKDAPQTEEGKTAEERLHELIGMDSVKSEIDKMFAIMEKNKGDLGKTNLHMCFYGNPGTGKTEVANLIANIFYDKGILPTNKLICTNASGLVAGYTGQTALKTHKVIKDALNGVLFIDEAYALNDGGHGFGKEAVAALLEDMENYRGKFAVIMAGYRDEMEELFSLNPGFDSRINRKIEFPDYSTSELLRIAQLMIDKKKYVIEDEAKTELGNVFLFLKEFAKAYRKPFANAREVRNILESIYEIQALRTIKSDADNRTITISDIKEYEDNHNIDLASANKEVKKHNFVVDFNKLTALSKGEFFDVDVDYIRKATVNIKVESPQGSGEGSGFFISSTGLIGTCAHVVNDADKITVIVSYKTDGDEFITKDYAAEVVAINIEDDTAVIGILSKNIKVSYYQLKNPEAGYPKLLTKLLMGGYPLGGNRFSEVSINEGTVQSINKDAATDSLNTWIYVDMSGLPGSSGSGVVNKETGQIEGIFAGCSINPANQSQTINRIIPVKYLWKLLAEYCGISQFDHDSEYIDVVQDTGADDNYSIKFEKGNIYKPTELNIQKTKEIVMNEKFSNIKIVRGDVTTYDGDAIVNAANKYLAPGAGVCGAVFRAAGYKELDEVCKIKGQQAVGSATLTSGFNLPASYIIHAVGPNYDIDRNPERLLVDVYRNCFKVCRENGIQSIAFPSISTGIYHFPIELACPIALREMMEASNTMREIVVYCFDDRTYDIYVDTLKRLKGIN